MTPAQIAAATLIHATATGLTLCLIAGLSVTIGCALVEMIRRSHK